MKWTVITSIHDCKKFLSSYSQNKAIQNCQLVIVCDKKSVDIASRDNLHILKVESQDTISRLASSSPYNHYCRKNLGYLYAMQNGAEIIYDTDDDTYPYENFDFPSFTSMTCMKSKTNFYNVLTHFTNQTIWPRGFPLNHIKQKPEISSTENFQTAVWQSLVDGDADVDAIYRLTKGEFIKFNNAKEVALAPKTYTPFNSQNTFWSRKSFPLMYLPVSVKFRFTDILRSYIAQRILWDHDLTLGYCKALAYQERNPHDLMRDFEDELDCYMRIEELVEILNSIKLNQDMLLSMYSVYEHLAKHNFVTEQEINCLTDWLNSISENY